MNKLDLSTTIVASTMDLPFIRHCVREAGMFSNRVSIMCYDKLFEGEAEDDAKLLRLHELAIQGIHEAGEERKENIALIFGVLNQFPDYPEPPGYYMGLRWAAFEAVDKSAEYILVIDADEIIDRNAFAYWLRGEERRPGTFLLENYWYFREPTYQAQRYERIACITSAKLIRQAQEEGPDFRTRDHRPGFYLGQMAVAWPPVLHHYSWVRTKDEMLRKCRNWSHKNDKPWPELIEEEFSRPFNGTDFVHGYPYRTVPNQFGIDINDPEVW